MNIKKIIGVVVCFQLVGLVAIVQGGVPDMNQSVAESAYTGPGSVVMLNSPNGDGATFTLARTLAGQQDATVTLTLKDALGSIIANFPAEDMWLESADGSMVSCALGSIANAETDWNGQTTWVNPLLAGGWSQANTIVMIAGATLMSGDLAISYNSVDMNGDLRVDLSDVSIFAGDFYGGYAFRADFFFDGLLNLSDIVVLARGLGSQCP